MVEFDDPPREISKPLKVLTDHTNTEKNYPVSGEEEDVGAIKLIL